MSIESFLRDSIPSPQFKQILVEFQTKETCPASLINILARRFVKAGSEGVREISKQLSDHAVTTADYGPYQRAVFLNIAGIVLGNTIPTIEEALVEKTINYDLFWARHNQALVGTVFKLYQEPREQLRPLSSEEWWQMIQLAQENKTLSNFFVIDNPVRSYLASKTLIGQVILPIICSEILPRYKRLAQSLIN